MLLHALLAVTLALTASARLDDGLTVQTQQGAVVGTLLSPSNTVRRFLGIPYAIANRWEPPKLPLKRTTTFNASAFGDSCPQALTPNTAGLLGVTLAPVPESENCLTVNVWAPSAKRKQKTAVMLWIYGGGFQIGTSNSDLYHGQNFVHSYDDIVVVTFNYRLNIFGQPSAPQLSTNTQNFGLLDITAAVNWVHDNIAAFGGDPDRIILFGESAGGAATDAYSYMHPNDNIVKGIIQQSGNLEAGITGKFDPTFWNLVSNAIGCGNISDVNQLNCMNKVPSNIMEEAVIKNNAQFGLVTDNITIFADFDTRAVHGDFLKVPLLAGSNQNEGDVYLVAQELPALGFMMPVLTEILSDIQTQLTLTCTTSKTVGIRVNASLPTWRYLYQGVFRDISPLPDLRAFHSSEIPLVFGNFPNLFNKINLTTPPPTADELALSKYMQSAWVAFARDPTKGLLNFGWPLYNTDPKSNATTLVELGGFYNRTGANLAQGRLLDFMCGAQDTLVGVQRQLNDLLKKASVFKSS